MKTKILIVDNEPLIRGSLRKMIVHYLSDNCIIEEADGVLDGLESIYRFQPDLLFLDVEMDDGTGFDLLNNIENPDFQLVFTTAHNQYAIKAFEHSALNYLLKPISPSALQKTLHLANEKIKQQDIGRQLQILMTQIATKGNNEHRITLRDNNGIYFIKITDIVYCKSDGPYTEFVIEGSEQIVISKNLKEYENQLLPYGFVRCHHSYLVNRDKIKKFDRSDSGGLILDNGQQIPVSHRKRDVVLEILEKQS
jgi:two-component system, LytTR family, response regulator